MATGLMRANPDGMIIGAGTSTTLAITPYEKPDIQYTFEDFKYLGSGMLLNYALVATSDKPYASLEDFVAFAKDAGRATVSVGSISYEIAVRQIAEHFDVNLVPLPSGGSSAALKDALGGHVDATVQGTAHVPQIEAGKMVQLATLTNDRAIYAPEARTLRDSGMDWAMDGHIIFMLQKDTPDDIHACLADKLAAVTESEEYSEFVAGLQTTASNLGPQGTVDFLPETAAFYKDALAK